MHRAIKPCCSDDWSFCNVCWFDGSGRPLDSSSQGLMIVNALFPVFLRLQLISISSFISTPSPHTHQQTQTHTFIYCIPQLPSSGPHISSVKHAAKLNVCFCLGNSRISWERKGLSADGFEESQKDALDSPDLVMGPRGFVMHDIYQVNCQTKKGNTTCV